MSNNSAMNLQILRLMEPEFAEAERKGEAWAINRADEVRGISGKASRRHPERRREENGKSQHWCSGCPHREGCITCDLDDAPPGSEKRLRKMRSR